MRHTLFPLCCPSIMSFTVFQDIWCPHEEQKGDPEAAAAIHQEDLV